MTTAVELFAGGGGLLLGSAQAGIDHRVAVEWNRAACSTIRSNAQRHHPLVDGINLVEGDVREVAWETLGAADSIDIVSGGPPCQPFSLGGLARAADDPRDMFPAMTEVVARLRPRAFIVENVKGLTRAAFADYFDYIQLRLQLPELRSLPKETWRQHRQRLRGELASSHHTLRYRVATTVVNAADYGVPQQRHRVFMVGFRDDIDTTWVFPAQTHSKHALDHAKATGEYWRRHPGATPAAPTRVVDTADGLLPWVTVRDALADMPAPSPDGSQGRWHDHCFQPGAKIYPGHTGSPLDAPSKALKAGAHGVPGGENMIRFADGSVRYFTVREAARIQTFPDDYHFDGPWSEVMRQLGNAVPVALAKIVATSVKQALDAADVASLATTALKGAR